MVPLIVVEVQDPIGTDGAPGEKVRRNGQGIEGLGDFPLKFVRPGGVDIVFSHVYVQTLLPGHCSHCLVITRPVLFIANVFAALSGSEVGFVCRKIEIERLKWERIWLVKQLAE